MCHLRQNSAALCERNGWRKFSVSRIWKILAEPITMSIVPENSM